MDDLQSPPSFDVLAARFHREVFPVAGAAIADLYLKTRGLVASDPEATRLLDLNFQTKARLLALGSCYAADIEPHLVGSLVATTVRWGALFTLIDTAIDEGGIDDRASCERLASWLLGPLSSGQECGQECGKIRLEIRAPIERALARICSEIHDALRPLRSFARLSDALRPLLERHARLIVFQHIAASEREAWLGELDASDYRALCVDGSPGPIFALIRAALSLGSGFDARACATIERLYFPEFGLLHVWVDDLADYVDDAGNKDLNLARLSEASATDPGAEFLALLESYLRRLQRLPGRDQVIFPLRLMIEEYFEQTRRASAGDRDFVRDTFQAAVELVRQAPPAPTPAGLA